MATKETKPYKSLLVLKEPLKSMAEDLVEAKGYRSIPELVRELIRKEHEQTK